MLGNKGGRPSIPAKIKELSGTIRKDRQREEVKFAQITITPKPAIWLDAKAKRYFKNICKLLISKELLNEANVPLVLIMAQEFATYEMASRKLVNDSDYVIGTKVKHQSPWVAIRNNAQKNFRDYAALFGLDPVSASKIGGVKKPDHDDFEQMQNKYKSDII